jgi:3-oxoacyl-(acyl-carrier-protein) synthase
VVPGAADAVRPDRRVVVTGMGAVTSLGQTVEETWAGLVDGRSGVGPITLFDASGLPVRIAAEVTGFDGDGRFGRRRARSTSIPCSREPMPPMPVP